MARKLSDIYNEIAQKRAEFLELTSFENNSKMSIMNAIMYIQASAIWTLENVMDVFQVDTARAINSRVNGTETYYINALKKYQSGDVLEVNDDGCSFSYPTVDESKRIITNAVCILENENGFYDRKLVFKVAKGSGGSFERVSDSELVEIRNYMKQIIFAGTNITIESMKGDVLVPKIVVCYDGKVDISTLKKKIINAMKQYLEDTAFTGRFYPSKLINCIGDLENVVDVISEGKYNDEQLGIYIAGYDKFDNPLQGGLKRYANGMDLESGYAREKNETDTKMTLPAWKDTILIITEDDLSNYSNDSIMLTLDGDRVEDLPTLYVNNQELSPTRQ